MAPPHRPIITITAGATGYVASINQASFRARPSHVVKWKVSEPEGFPADGVVFLQFYERLGGQKVNSSGCLVDGVNNNGKHKGHKNGANDHNVTGKIAVNAQGSFQYEIWFSDARGDHFLLDPEIVVEGTPDPIRDDKPPIGSARSTPRKGASKKRGKAAKKSAAKKSGRKASKATGRKKARKAQASKRPKASTKSKKAKKTAKRRAAKKR